MLLYGDEYRFDISDDATRSCEGREQGLTLPRSTRIFGCVSCVKACFALTGKRKVMHRISKKTEIFGLLAWDKHECI